MRIDGKPYRTIWLAEDGWSVEIIDQTRLPHDFATTRLTTLDEAAHAIAAMLVRGSDRGDRGLWHGLGSPPGP